MNVETRAQLLLKLTATRVHLHASRSINASPAPCWLKYTRQFRPEPSTSVSLSRIASGSNSSMRMFEQA